jgi:hypothetical protein
MIDTEIISGRIAIQTPSILLKLFCDEVVMKKKIKVTFIVLLGVSVFLLHEGKKRESSTAPATFTEAAASAKNLFKPDSQPVKAAPSVVQPRSSLDVLQTKFDAYSTLAHKAILSDDETSELKRKLSDPAMIAHAKDILLQTVSVDPRNPKLPDFDQDRLHMSMVSFLAASMGWTVNPLREQSIQSAVAVITRDISQSDAPLFVKKSAAGDQIELYESLLVADPAIAETLRKNAERTPIEKLIVYAIANKRRES